MIKKTDNVTIVIFDYFFYDSIIVKVFTLRIKVDEKVDEMRKVCENKVKEQKRFRLHTQMCDHDVALIE